MTKQVVGRDCSVVRTERTEFTGRLNRPTNKHIVEPAAGGISMDVSNINDSSTTLMGI